MVGVIGESYRSSAVSSGWVVCVGESCLFFPLFLDLASANGMTGERGGVNECRLNAVRSLFK